MAISFVAGTNFPFESRGSTVFGPPNYHPFVISKPTGTAQNDLLLCFCVFHAPDGGADTLFEPAGWTALGVTSSNDNTVIGVFAKIAGASEPSTYEFQGLYFDSDERYDFVMLAYRGTYTHSVSVAAQDFTDALYNNPAGETMECGSYVTSAFQNYVGILGIRSSAQNMQFAFPQTPQPTSRGLAPVSILRRMQVGDLLAFGAGTYNPTSTTVTDQGVSGHIIVSGPIAYTASLNETVTLSESISVQRSAVAALSETVTLSESLATIRGAVVALGETVSVSESVTARRGMASAVNETVSLSEALVAFKQCFANFAETLTIEELIFADNRVGLNESVAYADSVTVIYNAKPSVAETVTLAELLAAGRPLVTNLAETVTPWSATLVASSPFNVDVRDVVVLVEEILVFGGDNPPARAIIRLNEHESALSARLILEGAVNFTVGDTAKIKIVLGTIALPEDPLDVRIRVRSPANRLVSEYVYGQHASLVRESAGVYTLSVVVNEIGLWEYGWILQSPNGKRESSFQVVPSLVA